MAEDEQFSLCWNNFNSNLSAGFHESLLRGDLVDVTLAAEGQLVKAHRLILSVCSPYFRKMFTQMPVNQHAFIFLKDVSHSALKDLIQFIYCGEVNVKQDALPAFISTAEALQIKGLTESGDSVPVHQSPVKEDIPAVPVTASIPTPTTATASAQRSKTLRSRIQSYKIDSEESGDDKVVQIQASSSHHVTAPQIQTQTTVVSGLKRGIQRTIPSQISKRTKLSTSASNDGLELSDSTTSQVQTVQIVKQLPAQVIESEYIELPIESINPKAEPDYTEETAEIETVDAETEQDNKLSEQGDQGDADDEGNYVEDEAYGEMGISKYDDSYLTEGEDGGKPSVSGFVDSYTSDGGTGTEQSTQGHSFFSKNRRDIADDIFLTTCNVSNSLRRQNVLTANRNLAKLPVKSKAATKLNLISSEIYSASSPINSSSSLGSPDLTRSPDACEKSDQGLVRFIPSQKKCAQLVYGGYIYNRKVVQRNGQTTWRCSELLKYRCKATCVTTKLNQLVSVRRSHNHENHARKIAMKPLYDYPEDLEEYLNCYTRDTIDPNNQRVDVIDAGAEFRVVLRDQNNSGGGDDLDSLDVQGEDVEKEIQMMREPKSDTDCEIDDMKRKARHK